MTYHINPATDQLTATARLHLWHITSTKPQINSLPLPVCIYDTSHQPSHRSTLQTRLAVSTTKFWNLVKLPWFISFTHTVRWLQLAISALNFHQ